MRNFIAEVKEFAMRGNVMDLAIGVIIGGAFGKIVSSLVADIITPLLGLVLNNVKFTSLRIGPVMVGNFLQALIDFIIVAFVIFVVVKSINIFRRKQAREEKKSDPAQLSREEQLLTEIRDALQAKQ